MPVLAGSLSPFGPMVPVKVMQSPQRVAALKRSGRPYTSPSVVLGLIDTGASCSAPDRNIIASLELEFRGATAIHTPSTGSGFETRNQYDVTLVLGESQPGPLELTLPVIESDFVSQGFLASIGRDVLSRYVLSYHGPTD